MTTSPVNNPPQASGLTFAQAAKIASIVMLFLTAQTAYTAYTNSWNWSNFMDSGRVMRVLQSMAQATLLGAIGAIPRTIQVLVVFWAQPNLWTMIIGILQGLPQVVMAIGQRIASLFRRRNPPGQLPTSTR
jgi:hypothetical protein